MCGLFDFWAGCLFLFALFVGLDSFLRRYTLLWQRSSRAPSERARGCLLLQCARPRASCARSLRFPPREARAWHAKLVAYRAPFDLAPPRAPALARLLLGPMMWLRPRQRSLPPGFAQPPVPGEARGAERAIAGWTRGQAHQLPGRFATSHGLCNWPAVSIAPRCLRHPGRRGTALSLPLASRRWAASCPCRG